MKNKIKIQVFHLKMGNKMFQNVVYKCKFICDLASFYNKKVYRHLRVEYIKFTKHNLQKLRIDIYI